MPVAFQGAEWALPLLRHHWLTVVCTWLLCLGAAVWYVLAAPRVYRAEVVLAPAETDKFSGALEGIASQLGGLTALVGTNLSEGSNMDIAIATLTGRDFTQQFVSEGNLLPILFSERWDEHNKRWLGRAPSLSDANRLFVKSGLRTVLRDRRTGLVTLRVEFRDPALAARWATELVKEANARLRERAISDSRASIDYLDRQLAATQVIELRQAIHRLREAQLKRAMFAQVREEYALRTVDAAVVPDANDFVRPRRILILVTAAFVGVFAGLIVAALSELRRSS